MTFLDRSDLLGSHPQPPRYYLTLLLGTLRSGLDVAMLVLGTGLCGLAIAVLLDGFDLVDLDLGTGIGGTLGAALVIGVCGGFALGVASEGRYGMAGSVDGFPVLEVAIGRVVGIVLVSVGLLVAAGRLAPLVSDLPYAFGVAVEVIRSAGAAGFIGGLVGVPASWGVRRGLERLGWGGGAVVPTIYVVWVLAALIVFDVP
ncbi:MAG TPA: hypothetical protein VLB67_02520 [Acidimicrobiia bacterium]|nr:hypothetical protein [Acidimicrobiia bacterium]